MLFLVRSAVCIGAVALLVAGGDKAGVGRVIQDGGRNAAQSLGQACVVSNDCLQIGMGLVAAVGRIDPGRRTAPANAAVDTLTASDRRLAWRAPVVRRALAASHQHPATLAQL